MEEWGFSFTNHGWSLQWVVDESGIVSVPNPWVDSQLNLQIPVNRLQDKTFHSHTIVGQQPYEEAVVVAYIDQIIFQYYFFPHIFVMFIF